MDFNIPKKINFFIKASIILIPILIVFWLLVNHFAFLGKISSSYGFGINPSFISSLYPEDRVNSPEMNLLTNEKYQRAIKEPIYFSANIPRMFKKAIITLEFSSSNNIIELGIKKSAEDFGYEYKTVQNNFVDKVNENWNKLVDDDKNIALLEKGVLNTDPKDSEENIERNDLEFIYDNIEEFISDPPKNKKIGYFKYDFSKLLKSKNYKPTNNNIEINNWIRGEHDIYTYIQKEELDFSFKYYDINRGLGPDDFNIEVLNSKGNIVYQFSNLDDGNHDANGIASSIQEYQLFVPNLDEGVYKIRLKLSSDVLIQKIKTAQNKIIFGGHIYLAGNKEFSKELPFLKEKPTDFYGYGDKFKIKTFHPGGNQVVNFSGEDITLDYNNTEYQEISFIDYTDKEEIADSTVIPKKISSPKNDITVYGSYFVFSEDHFFDPNFGYQFIPLQNIINVNELDYILSSIDNYKSPYENKNWSIQTIEFDSSNAYLEEDGLPFILSIPNIKNDGSFKIKNINIEFRKNPIWRNFFSRLRNYIIK